MSQRIDVHFLPELVDPEALRGATVVVIDVLRASTTITQALAAGANEVVPCCEIEEVQQRAAQLERETIVLGGERGGLKIDLFDLGNRPSEYTPDSVGKRTVLFTTSNGTRAMDRCRQAYRVLIGSAVNLTALCESISQTLNVHLVCAGTGGEITREDVLIAGGIVYQWSKRKDAQFELNDSALLAQSAWRNIVARAVGAGVSISDHLADELRSTKGGQNLLRIGHGDDLSAASRVDALPVVPELDLEGWRIRLP